MASAIRLAVTNGIRREMMPSLQSRKPSRVHRPLINLQASIIISLLNLPGSILRHRQNRPYWMLSAMGLTRGYGTAAVLDRKGHRTLIGKDSGGWGNAVFRFSIYIENHKTAFPSLPHSSQNPVIVHYLTKSSAITARAQTRWHIAEGSRQSHI